MYLSVEEIQNLIKKEKQKWIDTANSEGPKSDHLRRVSFYALKSLNGFEQETTSYLKKKYNIK